MKKLSILASILALLINFSAVANEAAAVTGTCTSNTDKSIKTTTTEADCKDGTWEAPKAD